MTPISAQFDAAATSVDNTGGSTSPCFPAADSLFWRQVRAEGLEAVAEKVAAAVNLDLGEAIALQRSSLPLLGKLVEIRAAVCGTPDVAADSLPVDRASIPSQSPRTIEQPAGDWGVLCRALLALRDNPSRGDPKLAWAPLRAKPLDQDACGDGRESGVEILRAIALARLLLPAEIEIRAPLALLGPKLAQVALDFGASHLGCVAPEGQVSADPRVADASVLDELTGSCPPTSLREET